MSTLSRREFVHRASVTGLGLLAGCGRLPWQAEPTRVPRIGYLSVVRIAASEAEFLQGLGEHGYVEGENVIIERRDVGGQPERYPELAAEFVALPVDLIFAAGGTPAVLAARQATSTIPIVVSTGELIGTGLVASLARPGGNVTGLTNISPELSGKRLELLKETVPGLSRVAVVVPDNPTAPLSLQQTELAAQALGVTLRPLAVREVADFEVAFETAREQTEAILILGDALVRRHLADIAALASRSRLPSMHLEREFALAGGFMAYGSNLPHQTRRAAAYVAKILKGAQPADLPIEQPTTFDFVINLKTAQALGLTIPQHVLLQATEVIQ
jgi:putative tryptophan/tyrosine transport system substrate-binding protein